MLKSSVTLGLLLSAAPIAVLAQATSIPSQPAPPSTSPAPSSASNTPPSPAAIPSPRRRAQSQNQDDDPDEIVVTAGARQRGAVIGDIKPEVQLSPADIRSYGASSINELLSLLTPQTTSGRGGSPVILLNGKRISGFFEVRDIPPEAIARVDILPEEVALKYGYSSDQKVVNIVLRQRFRAYTAELNYGLATQGGAQNIEPEATFLRIRKNGRLNIAFEDTIKDALFEDQRNITSTPPTLPYALGGNVVDSSGTTYGVLPNAGTHIPTLADFSTTPNTTSLTPYRTLQPESKDAALNAVYNHSVLGDASATINARLELTNNTSDNGLPTLNVVIPTGNPYAPFVNQPVTLYRYLNTYGPLTQNNKNVAAHLGATVNGDFSRDWHWSFTGNYDFADSKSITDTGFSSAAQANLLTNNPTLNPYGPISSAVLPLSPLSRAHSRSNTGVVDVLVNGEPFKLPAGAVSTSFKASFQDAVINSDTERAGTAFPATQLTQTISTGRVNLDVPIASRKKNVLRAIGELSLNGNFAAEQLSGFGTLTTTGYGFNWAPLSPLQLIVAVTNDHAAPTVNQLNAPQVITPNALVFDPLTGQTVSVTQISGGNSALKESDRHVLKLEANLQPFSKTDLKFNVTYTRTNTNNLIASPTLTQSFTNEQIDPNSGVITINTSPTNFARAESDQLRMGINFSKPIKSNRPPQQFAGRFGGRPDGERRDGARPDAGTPPSPTDGNAPPPATTADAGTSRPPPAGGSGGPDGASGAGGFGGRGRGGGGFGQQGGGRLQVSLYYTLFLHDTLLTQAGARPLNLLNGDAAGSSGGQPRHQVQLDSGFTRNGLGMRLSATWLSATTVDGLTPAGTLHFGEHFTTSFRIFDNLGANPSLARNHTFFRGTRVLFVVTNIFGNRQHVTDGTGAVPLSYQPDYLDPAGRTVRIAFRKLFF